jgi:long-chain acyl-CoA synthetase
VDVSPRERVLSMLPPWHVYERSAENYVYSRGATVKYTNVKRLAQVTA